MDHAFDLEDIFEADLLDRIVGSQGSFGVEHDLHQTLAVAQVEEDEAAVVATPMDPTGEGHLVAYVLFS